MNVIKYQPQKVDFIVTQSPKGLWIKTKEISVYMENTRALCSNLMLFIDTLIYGKEHGPNWKKLKHNTTKLAKKER